MPNGVTVDLLRRAQVPLAELVSASGFSFERWRQKVEMWRRFEDFYLDVAEQVTTFEATGFTANSPTPRQFTRTGTLSGDDPVEFPISVFDAHRAASLRFGWSYPNPWVSLSPLLPIRRGPPEHRYRVARGIGSRG